MDGAVPLLVPNGHIHQDGGKVTWCLPCCDIISKHGDQVTMVASLLMSSPAKMAANHISAR